MIRGERSLEFFNGQLVLITRANGAGEHYKFLSPAAVAAAFRNLPFDSGWLPPSVLRCGSTPRGDFAVLFVPGGSRRIEVETGKGFRTISVHLPGFIFLGYGSAYSLWALRTAPDPKAQLFNAPLPNVFGNGSICWGTNKPPKPSGPAIVAAWELFISSPFTSHAANGKSRAHNGDIRPLLLKLARGKKKFPVADLVPFNRSLENVVESITARPDEPNAFELEGLDEWDDRHE